MDQAAAVVEAPQAQTDRLQLEEMVVLAHRTALQVPPMCTVRVAAAVRKVEQRGLVERTQEMEPTAARQAVPEPLTRVAAVAAADFQVQQVMEARAVRAS
jgi:hypothetical protein